MHREGEFVWVAANPRVVTNSVAVRDNVNRKIEGKHWMKTLDNKWMIDVVVEGVNQEKEMKILGLDANDAFAQDSEAFISEESDVRKYWDDLSGKELNPKLVKKARMEEMKEVNKHNVYVKVPIEECWPTLEKIQFVKDG